MAGQRRTIARRRRDRRRLVFRAQLRLKPVEEFDVFGKTLGLHVVLATHIGLEL